MKLNKIQSILEKSASVIMASFCLVVVLGVGFYVGVGWGLLIVICILLALSNQGGHIATV